MSTQRELELQLVNEAQKRGMTPDKIKEAVQAYRAQSGIAPKSSAPTASPKTPAPAGFVQSVRESFGKRQEQVEKAADLYGGKEQTLGESALQTGGAAVGLLGDIAFQGIRAITPKPIRQALAGATEAVVKAAPVQAGIQKAQEFSEAHPRAARNIGAAFDVASAIPPVKGVGLGLQGVAKGVQTGIRGAEAVADVAKVGLKAVEKGIEAAKSTGGILRRGAEKTAQFVEQAPMRLKTAAEKAAEESVQLAKAAPEVRKAVINGIELRDANLIKQATEAEKDIFRDMVNQAKTFEMDRSSLSSADVAGNQLQRRIGQADELRKKVGAELGESVKGLKGEVVAVKQKILKRLQEIPGMRDVKVNNKGQLDFSKTTISLDKAAQNEISRVWTALKGRDAFRLHQLRQELFEMLGGKQKAQILLTETQEKGLESFRQGIADALEEVSPKYRNLNRQYAQVAEPMKRLRKFFRGLEGASEDILDEQSGNLLRRLTSNAPSAAQLRQAINDIDAVLANAGMESGISLQKLQDFQNVLERTLDITKDTGLAGQVSLGVRKGGLMGMLDKGVELIESKLGATSEVKRKMIEELLGL